MNSRPILFLFLLLFAFAALIPQARSAERPNFVFFFIDDLGWADLGCYGSEFHDTPNLDRLAREGMRFTDAYAACPVCSPTRAALMSGKYPARLGITDWIGASQKRKDLVTPLNGAHLPLQEVTIGEAMAEGGYSTAYFGKWHLGAKDEHHPEKQGFAYHRGVNRAGQPGSYFYPYSRKKKGNSSVPDFEGADRDAYLTDLIADEAVKFVEAHKDKPFFAMVAHYSIHTPIQAKQEHLKKYRAKLEAAGKSDKVESRDERGYGRTRLQQNNPGLAGMVESVDASVGKMLAKLDELGIADRTVIIFTSDNGGLSTLQGNRVGPGCTLPLRGGKGWMYEGGVRVPLIVKWPGVSKAGATSSVPVTSTDYYPTVLEIAGLPARPNQHVDGVSLAGLLRGQEKEFGRESIFWHYPHYHGSGNRPTAGMRKGDYKLVRWYESGTDELFNLARDLGEAKDLSEDQSSVKAEMAAEMDAWLKEVGARMAVKNNQK